MSKRRPIIGIIAAILLAFLLLPTAYMGAYFGLTSQERNHAGLHTDRIVWLFTPAPRTDLAIRGEE